MSIPVRVARWREGDGHGLFGWRAPPRQPQADESPIQALHPDFFCGALAAAGTAPTTEKIDAAAKMMAAASLAAAYVPDEMIAFCGAGHRGVMTRFAAS